MSNNDTLTKSDLSEMEERLATRLENKMGDLFTTQTGYLETKMGKLGGEIVEAVDHIMEKRIGEVRREVGDVKNSINVLSQKFMNHDGKVIEEVRREVARQTVAPHA